MNKISSIQAKPRRFFSSFNPIRLDQPLRIRKRILTLQPPGSGLTELGRKVPGLNKLKLANSIRANVRQALIKLDQSGLSQRELQAKYNQTEIYPTAYDIHSVGDHGILLGINAHVTLPGSAGKKEVFITLHLNNNPIWFGYKTAWAGARKALAADRTVLSEAERTLSMRLCGKDLSGETPENYLMFSNV